MDLINKDFENLIGNQYLTENISILLYSLIKTTRPLKLIEFGMGYSTLCIAKALFDIQKEQYNPKYSTYWDHIRNSYIKHDPKNYTESRYSEVINKFYEDYFIKDSNMTGSTYDPIFITVDNNQSPSKIINQETVLETLNKIDCTKYVKIVCQDFMKYINEMDDTENLDFVWVDVGSGLEYKNVFDKIFPKMNPAGIIAFHSVATNISSRLFLSEMKLKSKISDEFEMLTLLEPHKKKQNSIVVFKKNCDYPIYNELI